MATTSMREALSYFEPTRETPRTTKGGLIGIGYLLAAAVLAAFRKYFSLIALLGMTSVLLAGCGGGGSSTPATVNTLSGVAAVGAPIVNGNVNVICAAGSALTTTTDSTTGAWIIILSGQTLPCALEISGGTINGIPNATTYHSIAITIGNVNITPLADLLVANLVGTASPGAWFAGLSSNPAQLAAISQAQVDTALANLGAALSGLTPLGTTNPITTPFTPTPGNIIDDMLTALATAMTNTGVTYASLLSDASTPSFTAPSNAFSAALTAAYAGTPSGSSYAIGGTVTGLIGSIVLQNNGGNDLTVPATGTFTFTTQIANGSHYGVTVLTQPSGQTCTVSAGAGTVSGGNVINVAVVCSTLAYSVGGTVSGLVGSMVLQDNNGDNLTVAANGAFTFPTMVAYGSNYSVTVLSHPAGQSCSATNGTGTIAAANVTNVAITCATNTYTIGGTVTGLNGSMVLQDNGGDNLTVSTNGSFTFPTAVANGSPYNVTVLTQPAGQTCAANTSAGTVSGGNISNVVVTCATGGSAGVGRFAYVSNGYSNDISAYTINAATGALTAMSGSPFAAGTFPVYVTIDPSGKFAYVGNYTSNNVSAYTINATTGALTPVMGSPFASGTGPGGVTIDPSGKFAYVGNSTSNNISAYTINATTGALTAVTGSPFAAGTGPRPVTFDPNGKFAYVSNLTSNDISAYTINATTGALTAVAGSPFAAGTGPYPVTIDPSGKFAYVSNAYSNDISAYTIDTTTGALMAVVGSPFAAGTVPLSFTIEPSGKFVYVANLIDNNVSAYTIDATTGALTAVAGSPFAAGTGPVGITIDPSGKFAYVTNFSSSNVSAYTINATTGVLTAVAGSPFATGSGPRPVTLDPSGKFAYSSSANSNNISAYTINATTGALTAVAGSPFAAGTYPGWVTVLK